MTSMCHRRTTASSYMTRQRANAVHRSLPRLTSASIPPRRRQQGTDRPDPEKDITLGKHSLETLTHEEQDGERRLSAAEREMIYHTLASHRMKLLAQGAELALRLGEILAEVERLDQQLGGFERPEFWRAALV